MKIESIHETLVLPSRKLVVSSTDIDLSKKNSVDIFLLLIQESRGSAGGRGGGSGARRIQRVLGYTCEGGNCNIIIDTSADSEIEKFEIPYSAVAMDIKLEDGKDIVVQGVVDPILVKNYKQVIYNLPK